MRMLCLAGVTLVLSTTVWAQTAPPTCEQALDGQYRLLVSDKLLQDSPGMPWSQQLTTLVTQIRTGQTQYDIKKNQAELAEKNVAQLLEQLRHAQQQLQGLSAQNAELRSEVDKLKNVPPEQPKN